MKLEKYKIVPGTENLTFYNSDGNAIGIVEREEGIKQGLLLEAVQLWIINPNTQEVLMQKRSKNKKHNPNKIDVSVSGHVVESEVPLQAILREAKEEIGIEETKLQNVIKKISQDTINLADYGREGRYIAHIYLAFLDNKIDYYTKQETEVEELFFMPYEELKRRVRHEDEQMLMPNSKLSEKLFNKIDEQIKLKQTDNQKTRLD